ncbi:hypothetical protein ACS0TY_025996 [Phlomoides rotata]
MLAKALAHNFEAKLLLLDLNDFSHKLNELTVAELKFYLTVHNLPVAGKKEALISRILTHMCK